MQTFISGKRIEYDVVGKGDPILLVHGWAGNRKSLSGLANLLKENYKCYLIDLPGRGGSDNPSAHWGVEEYGNLVGGFIKSVIKRESVIYIGTSFGGALGVYLASTSKLISKLVLCAPSFRRERDFSSEQKVEKVGLYSSIRRFLKKFSALRKLYYKVFFPHSELLKLEHLEPNFLKVIETDLTDSLKDIKVETLIIYGEDDIETPLYQAYILKEKIKKSTLKIYNSYGHELPVYFPDVIDNDIKLFLES